MNQTNNSQKIQNSVMQKIENQKPLSKQWYLLEDWSRLLLILVLAILAGLILGFYLWELVENLELATNLNFRFLILANSFVELLLVTFGISLILYFLYRQTDWFLVTHRWLIFGLIWLIILVISVIFVAISLNNSRFDNLLQMTREQTGRLPFRGQRLNNILERQKQNGFLVGRIVEIKPFGKDLVNIKIQNQNQNKVFQVKAEISKNLKKDDFVIVKIDPNNSDKVLEINKIRRPNPNQILPTVTF